jgi:hypothetical protein
MIRKSSRLVILSFCLFAIQILHGQSDGPIITSPPENHSVFTGANVALNISAMSSAKRVSLSEDGNTAVYDTGENSGAIFITYEFYAVPDDLRVYSEDLLLYDTGMISFGGTISVFHESVSSSLCTIVMNEDGANPSTAWDYTISTTLPLTYQWRKNEVAIPGATNNAYAITNAQLSDTGNYSVAVSNRFGVTISPASQVRVLDPNAHPALVINSAAGAFTISWPTNYAGFTLEASSNPALTNSWPVVTNAVFVNGIDWTVTGSTAGNRYYRLHKL